MYKHFYIIQYLNINILITVS